MEALKNMKKSKKKKLEIEEQTGMYIHVGLPKTGTSFLQKEVFPKIKEIDYFGKEQIITANMKKNKKNLYSDEGLSSINIEGENIYKIVERIQKIYPKAKIIITLRKKEEWKKSYYNQTIKKIRKNGEDTLSYAEWEKKVFPRKNIDYEIYVAHLKKLFDDVLVLDYELLKKNPKAYVKKICDFMGVKMPPFKNKVVNKSLKNKQLKLLNWVRKIKIKTAYNITKTILGKIN